MTDVQSQLLSVETVREPRPKFVGFSSVQALREKERAKALQTELDYWKTAAQNYSDSLEKLVALLTEGNVVQITYAGTIVKAEAVLKDSK